MSNICPICKKTKFNKEFEICIYCGWSHDKIQEKNVNYSGGSNDISLIKYKKTYQEIITKHPNYKWIYDQKIYKDLY